MKKRLLKVLGGVVVASPLIVMSIVSISLGYIMPIVFTILVAAFVVATTVIGLCLIDLSNTNDSNRTKEEPND